MTPAGFGDALGWPQVLRRGRLCWVSDRGTCVSVGHHGTRVRVTHRLTAEEWWVPCDEIGAAFCRAFDMHRAAS